MLKVAIGVVQNDANQFLMSTRTSGPYAGFWEFPGGKIEYGETNRVALKRELMEELGLDTEVGKKLMRNLHRHGNTIYDINFYKIKYFFGEIKQNVHDDIKWVSIEHLLNFNFISGDISFINKLMKENI